MSTKSKKILWILVRVIVAILAIALVAGGIYLYGCNYDNSRGPNYWGEYWTIWENMTDPFSFLPGLLIDLGAIPLVILAVEGLIRLLIWRSKKRAQTMTQEARDTRRLATGTVVLILVAIAFVVFALKSCMGGIFSSEDTSKCTICGKAATHTFQGSGYCTKHYNNAVKWAFDNVADDD